MFPIARSIRGPTGALSSWVCLGKASISRPVKATCSHSFSTSTSARSSSASSPSPSPSPSHPSSSSSRPSIYTLKAVESSPYPYPIPQDMEDFLRGYPNFQRNARREANTLFYQGEQEAWPSELTIDELLNELKDHPDEARKALLVYPWLFPTPDAGPNKYASKLQPHEVSAISSDPLCIHRLQQAYSLTLKMYGIRLIDPASGLLVPTWDFEDKARHLVSSTMHLHRITRILKSLVSLSPDPTSPLSVLHHVPSLILFLIAQHNSGRLNLAPGTLAGDELETRWNLCIRNRALREAISELVVTRLGMPESPTEDGRGSWKWTEAEYEAWVVSKARNAPDMKQVARLRQDADLEDMLLDEGEAGMYARAEKAERDRILAEENEAAERARTSAAEEAAKQKERQREDDTEEAKIRTAERVRTLGSDGEI